MLGIEEGTDEENLNKYVGHFEESGVKEGNIALAAHNRGFDVNYFSRLKELDVGDIIYYIIDNTVMKFEVTDILIIYETDWEMLENTNDNRITLITCVEDREAYRLCVQGVQIENLS